MASSHGTPAAPDRERRFEAALRMIAGQDFRPFETTPTWEEVLELPADEFGPGHIARAALEADRS